MKRKTCKTVQRRKIMLGILASVLLILCMVFAYGYLRHAGGYLLFRTPEHEAAAVQGVPTGDTAGNYETLPVKDGYTVGIDTAPVYLDGILYLNAANLSDNTVWFLARVYRGDQMIAQTGIFYPGEYVAQVPCSTKLSAGEKILVRILAYEPETYHSEGVAQFSTVVAAP